MERHSKWALAHIFKMIEIIEHEADQGALDHMLQNIHEPMVQLQIADEKSFEKKRISWKPMWILLGTFSLKKEMML